MATGGGHPSISRDSEKVFELECFNCSQEGKNAAAEVHCVECGDNLCRSCLNDHNKIARLRMHEVKDKPAIKSTNTQRAFYLPTAKCLQHHGKLIDTYCSRHDVVCCSVCVSIDHKSCPDINYIPTVSSGISTSKELQDAQTTTNSMKTQLVSVQTLRLEDLSNVRMQRIKALERASQSTQQLIKCIEELEEKATADINEKYKILEEAIKADLEELNKLIATLEDALSEMQKSQYNATKLFVHLKQNKDIISAGRRLYGSIRSNIGDGCCTFVTDDSIEAYLKHLKSLGNFEEDTEYSAVYKSDENIKGTSDPDTSDITGMCSLDDLSLLLADWNNDCLKQLDNSFQVVSQLDLPGKPCGLCQTGSTEVAFPLFYDKKIQFASVGHSMSLTKSFTTSDDGCCTGIACKDGHLYVSRREGSYNGFVQVYDMSGSLLQTIRNDKAASPMFKEPANTAISARSSNVYVTDWTNGLITVNESGELLSNITDPELKGACGICVVPGGQVLVCGNYSGNVIQFDGQGRKVRTLVTGLDKPRSMYFNPWTFKLIVGMTGSDHIKLYSLVKD